MMQYAPREQNRTMKELAILNRCYILEKVDHFVRIALSGKEKVQT